MIPGRNGENSKTCSASYSQESSLDSPVQDDGFPMSHRIQAKEIHSDRKPSKSMV